ncbi:hypothetical protein [Sphingosinicella sp. CPCC 101087]|uniref:hypothetical protein n=1 Tax=Sphingosinicella sp. CPCC 101087 TaxID=2497754 RepID=UPI00101D2B62|nr:hypothetical protein [Sphingosinicella sp. CPCC 101087]
MSNPFVLLVLFGTATIAIAIATAAAFRIWRDWLDLKRAGMRRDPPGSAGCEITDLRQRIRRLESIADGEV